MLGQARWTRGTQIHRLNAISTFSLLAKKRDVPTARLYKITGYLSNATSAVMPQRICGCCSVRTILMV